MSNTKVPADWAPLLREHQRKLKTAHAMGGREKLVKRKKQGRLNAREIIDILCDKDSFREIGALAGNLSYVGLPPAPADALIGGIAQINQREVVIWCEDFTVQGGSIGIPNNSKRVRLVKLAEQEKCPLVIVLDGAGERTTNALQRSSASPNDMQELARLSGQVPSVAVIIGSSAGHGAISAMLTDFIIMLESASMFAAGPPLVAASQNEIVTKEELGGAAMHTSISGVAHNIVKDEQAAAQMVRDYLSYLPQSVWQYPTPQSNEENYRKLDKILQLIPCETTLPYNIEPVIEHLVDNDSFFPFQPNFGVSLVTGFARLGGHSVAIVANQPNHLAGSIDHDGAHKATHFIQLADTFHLPVIFLTDNPGILAGVKAEQVGTLRAAAKMYAAQVGMRSAKLHVTLRKAFGFGSSLMAMNPHDHQTISLAFPGINLGGMPASGGARATRADAPLKNQLESAQNSAAWSTGDSMAYDDIIDPRELRNALLDALKLSLNRRNQTAGPKNSTCIYP